MRNHSPVGTPPRRPELRENPVKLCHDITRLSRAHMRRESDVEGVLSQPGARLILSHLAVRDGQSQLELVRLTHLQPPSVSVILRKLEEEGIVERRGDEGDRRVLRAYLTDLGRATDESMIRRIQKTDALALRGLSDEENETLMALLRRVRENLVAAEENNRTKGEENP